MRKSLLGGVILFIGLGYSQWALGIVVNLSGTDVTKDATIYSDATADNNGEGVKLFVGATLGYKNRRTLIQFDLSTIPSTATIDSVALRLELIKTPQEPADSPHSLFRVLHSWSEGTGVAESGMGGQIVDGGVAWTFRQYPSLLWDSEGVDYSSITSASVAVGFDLGPLVWTGAGMVNDIQNWVNGIYPNYGWLLMGDETLSGSARIYASSEDLNKPPLLTVGYSTTVPVKDWMLYN